MKTASTFRGDSELLVDALISASQAKANSSGEVLPGYGRDLVPYFESGEHEDSDLQTGNGGGQLPFQGIAPPRRVYADCGAPMADSAPMPIPQTQGRGKKGKKNDALQPQHAIVVSKSPPEQKRAAKQQQTPKQPERWAGPAFSNSPAPAALPVPLFMQPSTETEMDESEPQTSGSQLLQLLQGASAPPAAAPQPVPQQPAASNSVDLLQMLQSGSSKPAAEKPLPPPKPSPAKAPNPVPTLQAKPQVPPTKSGMPLLTPDMLAKMVAQSPKPAAMNTPTSAQNADTVQKLRSVLAPRAQPTAAPAEAANFQQLLMKLAA